MKNKLIGPRFHRGWYVTNVKNGIKGKIIYSYYGRGGYEYQVLVNGTYNTYLNFSEADLIREGNQSNIKNNGKVK